MRQRLPGMPKRLFSATSAARRYIEWGIFERRFGEFSTGVDTLIGLRASIARPRFTGKAILKSVPGIGHNRFSPNGQQCLNCLSQPSGSLGSELRRPEADFPRDGIYELRASLQGVRYQILYFFHGTIAAVVSHGICRTAGSSAEGNRACHRAQKAI